MDTYDQHSIDKIEPGKLWLKVYGMGEEPITIGPLLVPKKATDILQDGWEIGCSLARIKGNGRSWRSETFIRKEESNGNHEKYGDFSRSSSPL